VALRITPRTLKGFADELPARAATKEWCISVAKGVFRRFGYQPIETPSLEYAEILMGKLASGAELERQIYRFEDRGQRDVALRFDLTVPLARFIAQHRNDVPLPFRRYQVGNVWRGENPQAGRQREFTQCDVDILGTTAPAADGEILALVGSLMHALHMPAFEVRVNDRRLLSAILDEYGVGDRTLDVMRSIDKLPKLGAEVVAAELGELNLSAVQVDEILDVCSTKGAPDDILPKFSQHADSLRRTIDAAFANGLDEASLVVDLSIARGLDYYTGTVFETFLESLPAIGSICSGGRYNDLAALYTNDSIPGVGASLGLTRVLDAWEKLGVHSPEPWGSMVLVVRFKDDAAFAETIARQLRDADIPAAAYPDPRKLGDQLKYAERIGCEYVVICGPEERANGTAKLRRLATREEEVVSLDALPDRLRG
jgi:histidyl-tRNA synthetase